MPLDSSCTGQGEVTRRRRYYLSGYAYMLTLFVEGGVEVYETLVWEPTVCFCCSLYGSLTLEYGVAVEKNM